MAIASFCFDHVVNTIYTISIFPFCDFHILRDKFIEETKIRRRKIQIESPLYVLIEKDNSDKRIFR